MRAHHAVLLLAATALLAGCSSTGVVDVPESARTTAPSAVAAPESVPSATAATVAPAPELDCSAALPASAVETAVGLPAGTAALVQAGDTCSYGIAGNPSAVLVSVGPARLAETFAGAGEAVGAVPAPLGEAAYRLDGSAATPSQLAVLAGGYELHVESFVGDQDVLADWAVAVFEALGVRLSAG